MIRRDDHNYAKEGNDDGSKWQAKARTAKTDMEEVGGRECEKSRVKDRENWRSNEMEGRCGSNRGGDEVRSPSGTRRKPD